MYLARFSSVFIDLRRFKAYFPNIRIFIKKYLEAKTKQCNTSLIMAAALISFFDTIVVLYKEIMFDYSIELSINLGNVYDKLFPIL